MKNRPLIGITPFYDYDKGQTYIKRGYCEGIVEAGGVPVVLPVVCEEELLSDLFSHISGLLLAGGPDVDAKYFSEPNMPCNGTISPFRDAMEIYLARKAISEGMPVLGICRGIQVMNIAMGGNIYQDIYTQVRDKALIKHSQEAPTWYPAHEVTLEEGSKIRQAYGVEKLEVNSFHHQALKDAAEGFEITAGAPDGTIEAVEYNGHPFAVGVQWHPELMWKEDRLHLKLFEAFVESCALYGNAS